VITELLTINEAQAMARDAGQAVPGRTIRYACKEGFIRDARKIGRDWAFSRESFLAWLGDRPKPGRKPGKS
jgi:hypothetical protein